MKQIRFRKGYKYQLQDEYQHPLPKWFGTIPSVSHPFYAIWKSDGAPRLVLRTGYAWDGASGPAVDSPNFMRGSLVHDVMYQMLSEGTIPDWVCVRGELIDLREWADQELVRICREDGMSKLRASWVYRAVRMFGDTSSRTVRPIYIAP